MFPDQRFYFLFENLVIHLIFFFFFYFLSRFLGDGAFRFSNFFVLLDSDVVPILQIRELGFKVV